MPSLSHSDISEYPERLAFVGFCAQHLRHREKHEGKIIVRKCIPDIVLVYRPANIQTIITLGTVVD